MNKILLDELKRIRSILSAVTGFEDDDQEYVEDARKSVNRIIKELADQTAQKEPVGPSGDSLRDFKAEQWWLPQLEDAVRSGTPDHKRAVAVVRNMLATAEAHLAAPPPPPQPLTDARLDEIESEILQAGGDYQQVLRAVADEAAHGITKVGEAEQGSRVDCGECPNSTGGRETGSCMKGGDA